MLHIVNRASRGIDNQLRGRSGRQGDPGSSRFYLSLEDELMRLFGGETISTMMDRIGFTEDEPIEHGIITKSVETAQKRVEAHNFSIRKNVVEYDNVLNKQRETVYRDRTEVLYAEDLEPIYKAMQDRVIERRLDLYWPVNIRKEEADLSGLSLWARDLLPRVDVSSALAGARTREDVQDWLARSLDDVYSEKKQIAGPEWNRMLRVVIVLSTDREWVNQLHEMEDLREGVGLQAYGQRTPSLSTQRLDLRFTGHMQAIEDNVIGYVCGLDLKPQGSGAAPRKGLELLRQGASGSSRDSALRTGTAAAQPSVRAYPGRANLPKRSC